MEHPLADRWIRRHTAHGRRIRTVTIPDGWEPDGDTHSKLTHDPSTYDAQQRKHDDARKHWLKYLIQQHTQR